MAIEHMAVQIRQTLTQEIKSRYIQICKEVPIYGHRTCDSPNPPDSKPKNFILLWTCLQKHTARKSLYMTIDYVPVQIRQKFHLVIDTFAKKSLSIAIEHVTVKIRQTLNQEISYC
jgi:hypothetical protein